MDNDWLKIADWCHLDNSQTTGADADANAASLYREFRQTETGGPGPEAARESANAP